MHAPNVIGRALATAVVLLALAAPAHAQTSAIVPLGQRRTAQGVVQRPGKGGTAVPIAHQWVVVHRVGQSNAGPLDSVRTNAAGVYRLQYKTSGSPDAVYFASTMYAGIAYFTSPFESQHVSGADGAITVFDTTSRGITLTLAGRHVVVGAPQSNGVREVAEVFDLQNSGDRTLIARDTVTPLWTGPLPAGAITPAVSGGDVAPGGVTFADGRVEMFAPVSPGVRQLAVSFGLPPSAFPLSIPMTDSVGVLEVLLEETSATPSLPGLAQQSSVSAQGHNFKRYMAQNVPSGAVLRIDAGVASADSRSRYLAAVAFAMALLLTAGLIVALARRRRPSETAAPPRAPVTPVVVGGPQAEPLLHQLAQLDAAFARESKPSAARTARHESERAALKARIAEALAAEERAP